MSIEVYKAEQIHGYTLRAGAKVPVLFCCISQ
jgi:hypothetical protein